MIDDNINDHDVTFAATAFAAALPSLEFRPNAPRAPRRSRRGPAAIAASVATLTAVAITTTAVMSTGGNAPAAWSATPKHLSSIATSHMDQQCRAATVPDGTDVDPGRHPSKTTHTDSTPSGVTSHGSEPGGISVSPPPSGSMRTIGDLPLILIDARGAMALALYGDANHHIICTLDPDGQALLTPDAHSWPTGHLIDAAASFGTASLASDGTMSGAMKLLGTTQSDVTAISVDVPGVGTVQATVRPGYYALFVPQNLIGRPSGATPGAVTSSRRASWTAHVTTSDGTVHETKIDGVTVTTGPDGAMSVRGGNQPG